MPDIDESLDEAPAKTTFWNAFKALGPVVGRAAAVLSPRRVVAFVALAALIGVYYGTHQWWFSLSLWWDIALLAFVLIPAVFGFVWLALPLWDTPLRRLLRLHGRLRRRGGDPAVGRRRARSPTSPSSPR